MVETLIVMFKEGIACLHVIVYTTGHVYWFHDALKTIHEEMSNQRLSLAFGPRFL